MRAPNPTQVKVVEFHRRFTLAVEDRDPRSKPLRCVVHRWFRSANIRDLYIYREPDDFLRIGSRLLGRGGLGRGGLGLDIEPRCAPAVVLAFPTFAAPRPAH
jgi:hypothetical protein